MLRHPWARRVLEERGTAGVAVIGYIESVLAILRDGGFSLDLAHHALHVLGSRIFGFNQDLFDDSGRTEPSPEAAEMFGPAMAARYPRVTELADVGEPRGRPRAPATTTSSSRSGST